MHMSLLVFGLLFCICNAVPVIDIDDNTDTNKSKMKFRDILEQYTKNTFHTHRRSDQRVELVRNKSQNLTIFGFKWDNCGSSADAVHVKTLSVSPDPIVIPGKGVIAFDVALSTNVTKPTKIVMEVYKSIFGAYIKLPCVDNLGSCTYSDPCALLAKYIKTCPQPFIDHGIPCHCPFNAGEYVLPSTNVTIPKIPIPSTLENGKYHVKGTLYNGNTELACFDVFAALKAA